MSGVNIPDLPLAGTTSNTDVLEIYQSDGNKRIPLTDLATALGTNATLADVLANGNTTDSNFITLSTEATTKILFLDGSGQIRSSAVSSSVLQYIENLTADAQLQIDSKTWKSTCRVASTANINLASVVTVVDGITLNAKDRVLVKDQTNQIENGIYSNAGGILIRATDFTSPVDYIAEARVPVSEGTANADSVWKCTNVGPVTFGTTSIAFVQETGSSYIGTSGEITVTGNVIGIDPAYQPALPTSEIAVGDGSNKMSGSSSLTWNSSSKYITLDGSLLIGRITGSDYGLETLSGADLVLYGPGSARIKVKSTSVEIHDNGTTLIDSLAGTGSRLVAADASGVLSAGGNYGFSNQYSTTARPTITLGLGAATTGFGSASLSTPSNNQGGVITLTTGGIGHAPVSNDIIFTITPSGSFSAPNNCLLMLTPADATTAAAGLTAYVDPTASSTTSAVFKSGAVALGTATTYTWIYSLIYI